MAPETLIFMPNGDVTLTLIRNVMKDVDTRSRTPSVSSNLSALEQTLIDEDARQEAAPGAEPEAPAEPEESVLYFAPDPPEGMNGPFYPPPPRAGRGSDASSRRDRSTSPPASFWASLKRQAAKVIDAIEDEPPVTPPKPAKKPERIIVSSHEVHCVVSSRHMMLASRHFERILSGNFNEAITLRTKGHVSIPLLADLDSMIILLNIVHGASRKVPRQVSLEVLSKLAVLVSSLGMLETVQFFSDTWIDNLQREGLPKSYNENVLPLLFIFWVFDRPSEFKNMTRLTQRECDEKLDEDVRDVPIPHSIIDAIKRDREFAMETAITVIHALITRYMDGQTICDGALDDELRYACDAMVLGSLMKSSRKIGIWPRLEAPFGGRRFKDLARAIRSIRILDVCKKGSSRRFNGLGPSSNCHGLEDSIEASMKSIEAGLDGLELSDYAKKSEDYNSGLQMFPPPPPKEELKEQTKEDAKTNFQIYRDAEVSEAPKDEAKIPQREYSVPESRFSTHTDSMEVKEPVQEEAKVLPRQHPREFQQSEQRVSPRQYPREFQQSEPRVSPRDSALKVEAPVKEEGNANSRDFPSQEVRMPVRAITKTIDETPIDEVKPTPREEVKVLADRKLNRTTSFPKIPRDEVKSPLKELQVAPRVASIEEMIEEVSHPEKAEVKPPTTEARETLNEAPTTTEDEEALAPPQNFKMRKSKKKFSTRF